jgi:hypothetical protein
VSGLVEGHEQPLPSLEPDTIDNLAQPIACKLILLVEESFQLEVERGLVYPCQTMLDDVQIDTSFYAVVKVDIVHDNLKDLNLEVPPDDTTQTMQDAVTRRVQWRRTSIDVHPSTVASTSTTPSQLNTSPTSICPETRLSLSLNREQLRLSPIQEQLCPSIIQEQLHPSPILEQLFTHKMNKSRKLLLETGQTGWSGLANQTV